MQAMSERFEMRLDEETLRAVDGWRASQNDVPSRAEAVRRLVERGLRSLDQLHISGTEMLMLHMLGDLLKGLKVKTDINIEFLREVLYGGHFWALQWDMPGVFHGHVDSPETVTEVVDILEMWDFIETSYEELDAKGKAQLAKDADPFGKNPKFPGFDGNNETEHLGVARLLTEKMERFTRLKDRGDHLNSHMPTLDSYHRMLEVFAPMRKTLHGGMLSRSQLAEILNARIHPSMRKA